MIDQLVQIIDKEKERELIPFLKKLTPEHKKQAIPVLKKLSKDYHKFIQVGTNTWGMKGTEAQARLCLIASFVCYNKADFEKESHAIWIVDEEILDKILPWYSPPWLGDFLNGLAKLEYAHLYLHYDLVIKFMERGILQPSKELIVRVLTSYIFEQGKRAGEKDRYRPERLLKHPVTLKEHIWYLFELDSELHQSNRWLNFGDKISKEDASWQTAFKKLSAKNKIDRKRLLQESLLAGNRNFNKVLTGWFCDLFIQLEPTEKELMDLQPVLNGLLNSQHSKAVNTALDAIKQIVEDKKFDAAGFIDHASALFSSTTKAVIASTIQLAELIAKNHAQHRGAICRAAAQVFMQQDNTLQTKVAKLIVAYHSEAHPSFAQDLSNYDDTMLSSARKILQAVIKSGAPKRIETVEKPVEKQAAELIPLPSINNIDDLIFLASQATDNNQSWHIDAFPAAMLKLQKSLTGENIAKLEPALQRALKLISSGFASNQGQLDHFIATYIVDISITLINQYPDFSQPLREQLGKFAKKRGFKLEDWLKMEKGQSNLAALSKDYKDPFYLVYQYLLLLALQLFRQQSAAPLLSTPTHEPAWIDPMVLVERLAAWQQLKLNPDPFDLQVALLRCNRQNAAPALAAAKKLFKGESLNLLQFLFGKDAEPAGPFNYSAAWFTASLCLKEKKKYKAFEKWDYYKLPLELYTGQHKWESVDEEYASNQYDYKKNKYVPVQARRKMTRLIYPKGHKKKEMDLEKAFEDLYNSDASNTESDLLLTYTHLWSSMFATNNDKDVRRALLLIPNNIELLLADLLDNCLQHPKFWDEVSKRSVIAALQVLHEQWEGGGNMAHVFIAASMLSSDKTAANIAGEIWLKGVSASNINNAQLGKAIGHQLSVEFAPVKRFTDLVSQHLYRVSSLHNKSLQVLIEHILAELPGKPITNLKKLLEIHAELLSANKATITDVALSKKITAWKKAK